MKLLSPTQHRRLNEIVGFLLLSLGLVMLLSLISYHTQDPSFDTASAARPLNLVGYPGSYLSDLFFQIFGAAAFQNARCNSSPAPAPAADKFWRTIRGSVQ